MPPTDNPQKMLKLEKLTKNVWMVIWRGKPTSMCITLEGRHYQIRDGNFCIGQPDDTLEEARQRLAVLLYVNESSAESSASPA
jgi:hypothetical protein